MGAWIVAQDCGRVARVRPVQPDDGIAVHGLARQEGFARGKLLCQARSHLGRGALTMESFFHIRRTRIMFSAALAVLGIIAVSSCYTSPDPMRWEFARSPHGIEARFALSDRSRGATELLAVTDSGLVVLRGGRVVFIRYARIQSA